MPCHSGPIYLVFNGYFGFIVFDLHMNGEQRERRGEKGAREQEAREQGRERERRAWIISFRIPNYHTKTSLLSSYLSVAREMRIGRYCVVCVCEYTPKFMLRGWILRRNELIRFLEKNFFFYSKRTHKTTTKLNFQFIHSFRVGDVRRCSDSVVMGSAGAQSLREFQWTPFFYSTKDEYKH